MSFTKFAIHIKKSNMVCLLIKKSTMVFLLTMNFNYGVEVLKIDSTNYHEFIISYIMKIENLVPIGDKFSISSPTKSLKKKYNFSKTCEIDTNIQDLNLSLDEKLSQQESKKSIRMQTTWELYKMLEKYKTDILECLLQNKVLIDDNATSIDMMNHSKTILKVQNLIEVKFEDSVLTLNIFNKKEEN